MPFTKENAKAHGAKGGSTKSDKPKGFAKRPELASILGKKGGKVKSDS